MAPGLSGENEVVREIERAFAGQRSGSLRVGMGDDAALWRAGRGQEAILTCDWFLEGTHFLRDKQLDASRLTPKALTQVPNLDHYHVIIALAKEAEKAFPPKPRKVVFLDWNVADPSRVKGSVAEITAAYEATYSFLQDHIKDLVEAVLGDED